MTDPSAIAANRRGELASAQRAALRNLSGDPRGTKNRSGRPSTEALAERIEQAVGEVVWNGREYVAEADGHRLQPITGEFNLLPGAYRFFYLPLQRRVIAAERLQQPTEQPDTSSLLRALAAANEFDFATLAANREGRTTAADTTRLLKSALPRLTYALFGFIGAGLSAYFMIQAWITGNYYSNLEPVPDVPKAQEYYILAIWMAIFLAFTLALGVYFLSRCRPMVPDLRAKRVAAAEGAVWKATSGSLLVKYYYEINYVRFAVSRRGFDALIEGLPYRIYYLPHSRQMTGIEPSVHR